MKTKFANLSLRIKISSIYALANLLVFILTMVLLIAVNGMTNEMDMVYRENLKLNELDNALDGVQNAMTEYLNVKTSDALEDYYRCQQDYYNMVQELDDLITGETSDLMERNIKYMSENYLNIVSQTIEAKRGRNVEKYKVRYENATRMYDYIGACISGLNKEKFESNSEHYANLSENFRRFETASIAILAILIVGNIILMTNLVNTMIGPLRKLSHAADEVAKGNLDQEFIEVEAMDEVGIVTKAFNQMMLSIRNYITQTKHQMEVERDLKEKELLMETHLKDAQLRYLQAQINPHFLFNTLNAGAQLAMLEGADRTYDYVQNVALFFRYNMKKSNEIVSVGEEIQLVNYYISILNVRFSGDILYEQELDETLLDTPMPGMILQPIVENCVNHGIREKMGEGKISLRVYGEPSMVFISIRDNGKGMSAKTIEQILDGTYREQTAKGDSNGIGMDNVINRLRLFAGCEALQILSEGEGKGTEVILSLPGTIGGVKHV